MPRSDIHAPRLVFLVRPMGLYVLLIRMGCVTLFVIDRTVSYPSYFVNI